MARPLDVAPDALMALGLRPLSSEWTPSEFVVLGADGGGVAIWRDQSLNRNDVVGPADPVRQPRLGVSSIVWPVRDRSVYLRSSSSMRIAGSSVLTQFIVMTPYELTGGISVPWFLMRETEPYDELGLLCVHSPAGTILDFEHVDATWNVAWRSVQTSERPEYRGRKLLLVARTGDRAWVNGVEDGHPFYQPPVPDVEGPLVLNDTNPTLNATWYGEISEFILYDRPLSLWQMGRIAADMRQAHGL